MEKLDSNAALIKWAEKKYGGKYSTVKVLQETKYGGYCETCHYEYEVWNVYLDGEMKESIETDLASLLNQILESVA